MWRKCSHVVAFFISEHATQGSNQSTLNWQHWQFIVLLFVQTSKWTNKRMNWISNKSNDTVINFMRFVRVAERRTPCRCCSALLLCSLCSTVTAVCGVRFKWLFVDVCVAVVVVQLLSNIARNKSQVVHEICLWKSRDLFLFRNLPKCKAKMREEGRRREREKQRRNGMRNCRQRSNDQN